MTKNKRAVLEIIHIGGCVKLRKDFTVLIVSQRMTERVSQNSRNMRDWKRKLILVFCNKIFGPEGTTKMVPPKREVLKTRVFRVFWPKMVRKKNRKSFKKFYRLVQRLKPRSIQNAIENYSDRRSVS